MPFAKQTRSRIDDDDDVAGLPIMLFPSDSESETDTIVEKYVEPKVDKPWTDRRGRPEKQVIQERHNNNMEPAAAKFPPVPRHPIPSMQDAFAESLVEATQGSLLSKPKLRLGDGKFRRGQLLDQEKTAGPPAALWRSRPGQKCHELRRLLAQISFGVYLLLSGMANSQISVVTILQGHIDEVDEFLETTLEDMELAAKDITHRIRHLELPMNNMEVFETMLEDRKFRLQIVEGNEKIDHILSRTETALVQSMKDIKEGTRATGEFAQYLSEQEKGRWRQDRPDVIDIFEAMKGNTEGWSRALEELKVKGNILSDLIVKLNSIVLDIERRAGEVSRRTRFSVQPFTDPDESPRQSQQHTLKHTPPHSRQNSQSSQLTESPPRLVVPDAPPRLSLRLSTLPNSPESVGSYFDIPIVRASALLQSLRAEPGPGDEIAKELVPINSPPASPPARNPARLTATQIPRLQTHDESNSQDEMDRSSQDDGEEEADTGDAEEVREDKEDHEPGNEQKTIEEEISLFLLQPRTYTPQPPAPIPSPRILDEGPKLWSGANTVDTKPEVKQTTREERLGSNVTGTAAFRSESPKPRFEAPRLRPDVLRPESPRSRAGTPKPRIEESQPWIASPKKRAESPRARGASPVPRPNMPKPRFEEPRSAPVARPEQELQTQSRQRTSLRDRVSLKTTPPTSIQVPPPNALDLQRPVFPSPQTYQGPDSAYGSSAERSQGQNSLTYRDPSVAGFSPPVLRPALIPSPHSDQQYFRPVQASPHSPLQQRPHTAGTTVGAAPYHRNHQLHNMPTSPALSSVSQQHTRNAPSRMGGMSLLSQVTTMTQDTAMTGATGTTTSKGGRGLKKKRSAFGWLRKAFTLDDEERAAFEQRRHEQQKNLYYDGRSPQFLDGKRIQPRAAY